MNYTYPKTYKVKSLAKQENLIRKHFKNMPQVSDEIPEDTSEGLFLIPKWQLISSTYGEALRKVFDAIKSERPFYNYREGQLGADRLKESDRKIAAFKDMPDMMVIPAQFGQQHAGKSVRTVRSTYRDKETGLGAYEVAIMLLTHPERLNNYDDLWIDCSGDEYAPFAGGVFSRAPFFNFDDGMVRFGGEWLDFASAICGSASGEVPQTILESRNLGPLDSSSALKLVSEMEEALAKFNAEVGKIKAKYSA